MIKEAEKTLVVGLGKTGLSCVRYLVHQGEQVIVTDSRDSPPCLAQVQQNFPQVEIHVGGFCRQVLSDVRRIILSPGVSIQEPFVVQAQQLGISVLGDIELFAQQVSSPVIAITGSNGKSTVTSLVGAMALQDHRKVAVGGNLGTPVLDLIDQQDVDLFVLELSSFQLETTRSLQPIASTVLNISPDHMDRYADIDAYVAAKQSIFSGRGVMVLNADDKIVAAIPHEGRRYIMFRLGQPNAREFGLKTSDGETWLAKGGKLLLPVNDLRIKGTHNVANALAALALGSVAGLSMTAMIETLRRFPGLPHRSQWLREINGVQWYNDSKATNVGATVAAVDGFSGPLILIAGGEGKGADFSPLHGALNGKVKTVILLGRDAKLIEQEIPESIGVEHVANMQQAVDVARHLAQPGDTVLLSPACASFDMFRDYQHRGEMFCAAVERLN